MFLMFVVQHFFCRSHKRRLILLKARLIIAAFLFLIGLKYNLNEKENQKQEVKNMAKKGGKAKTTKKKSSKKSTKKR